MTNAEQCYPLERIEMAVCHGHARLENDTRVFSLNVIEIDQHLSESGFYSKVHQSQFIFIVAFCDRFFVFTFFRYCH